MTTGFGGYADANRLGKQSLHTVTGCERVSGLVAPNARFGTVC